MDVEQVLTTLYGYLTQYGLSVLAAVLILIIGKWVARLLSNFIAKPGRN